MAKIQWQSAFSTGIGQIDEQHKKLINLVNDLDNALEHGYADKGIRHSIIGLVEYAKKHFRDEEKFMEEIKYPELNRQRKAHKELVENITQVLMRLKNDEEVSPYELMNIMSQWVINHILAEDTQIGIYYMEQHKSNETSAAG